MASNTSSSFSTPWTSYFNDSEEIHQDGKVLIKLSDRKPVFIVPDIFREKVYINIREYTVKKPTKVADSSSSEEEEEEEEKEQAYLLPTKKGVCLNEHEFSAFVEKLQRVKSLVKRLNKKITKTSDTEDGDLSLKKQMKKKKKNKKEEENQDSDRPRAR